ncbi:MAG: MoxR family ATPase, partial [Rhizobacter sp.]|nr:MoxR family ATPase [Rhizobacter sp.]
DGGAHQVLLAGASPRGMSLLMRAARVHAWLHDRSYVTPEDVRGVFFETIAHRLCLQPVYEMRRPEIVAALMRGVIERVAAP